MADAYTVTVDTDPSIVVSGSGYTQSNPKRAIVKVVGADTVYFGGGNVDDANLGFPVEQDGVIECEAWGDNHVWAVVSSGTSDIVVLASGS